MRAAEYFEQHSQSNIIYAPSYVQFADVCRGYGLNARMQFYLSRPEDLHGHPRSKIVFWYNGDFSDRAEKGVELERLIKANFMKVVYI